MGLNILTGADSLLCKKEKGEVILQSIILFSYKYMKETISSFLGVSGCVCLCVYLCMFVC